MYAGFIYLMFFFLRFNCQEDELEVKKGSGSQIINRLDLLQRIIENSFSLNKSRIITSSYINWYTGHMWKCQTHW